MITNSLGIIIIAKNSTKTKFFPLKSSLAKAKAANKETITMRPVVVTENRIVLSIYFPSLDTVQTEI